MRDAGTRKRAFGRLGASVAAACVAVALAAPPAGAAAPGWPQPWYDGGMSGYTPQASPIGARNAATLTTAWSVAIPHLAREGAVVYRGLVITATSGVSPGHITAYRLTDGGVAWSKSVTDSGYVAADAGRVFASITDGPASSPFTGVVALDPATGAELWRRSTGELAPLRADGGRIFTLRSDDTVTVAIGERGGHIKWHARDSRVWMASGGVIVAARVAGQWTTGLDEATGSPIWDLFRDHFPIGSDPAHPDELAMSGGLWYLIRGVGACTCSLEASRAATASFVWDAQTTSFPTDGVAAGAGRTYVVGQRRGFSDHLYALDGFGRIVWMSPPDLVGTMKPTITRHLAVAVDLAGTGLVAFNVTNGHRVASWPGLVPAGMLRAPMAVGDSLVAVGSGRVVVLRLPAG
jgi:outer membrane protein assembly factor BamB